MNASDQPQGDQDRAIPLLPGLITAAAVGLIYLGLAGGAGLSIPQSQFPHLVLIADAFLHGRLDVRPELLHEIADDYRERVYRPQLREQLRRRHHPLLPEAEDRALTLHHSPVEIDWSIHEDKYYGYWAPMAALVMLPFVAVWGVGVSDVLVTILVGAASVFATYLMLRAAARHEWLKLTTPACIALTVLLGLGTVHFYATCVAQVWLTVQIVTVLMLTLAVWMTLNVRDSSRASWWACGAGLAYGAAFLTRNTIFFVGPFFVILLLGLWPDRPDRWPRRLRVALCFAFPAVAAGCAQLWYNHARFGNVFESGQGVQLHSGTVDDRLKQDYLRYGHLDLHYLPKNLKSYFTNRELKISDRDGGYTFDPEGNSMFLVTPALLLVFVSFRRRDRFTLALWSGVGPCLLVLLLFRATGYFQFGNRYLLDMMPLLVLLVAAGLRGRLTTIAAVLIVLSITVNAWGAVRFPRHVQWRFKLPGDAAAYQIDRGWYERAMLALRWEMLSDEEQRSRLRKMERLAWLRATCPRDELRDGPEALKLAEKVCRALQYRSPLALDTLAAAYAEVGHFDDAVHAASEAVRLAHGLGYVEFARQIDIHLENYKAGRPTRIEE